MAEQRGSREIPKGLPKDWRKLAEAMKAVGWTFEPGSRHILTFAPDGKSWTTLPKTPSEKRGYLNARAKFRAWCRENGVAPGI